MTTSDAIRHETTPAPTAPEVAPGAEQPAPKSILHLHQPAPTAPAETEFAREWFTYRGREWRIFKRSDGPLAKWYLYFEYKRQRIKHSLGEVAKAAAIETAKIKIDATLDGYKDTLRASMARQDAPVKLCTIGQLITSYEHQELELKDSMRHSNVLCLLRVLRVAHGQVDVDHLSSEVLIETPRLYYQAMLRAAKSKGSQSETARRKRSANSCFAQAKSMFKPKVVAGFRRAGLVLPDVAKFCNGYSEEKFDGSLMNDYDAPADSIIRKTLHAWLQVQDREQFLAIGLALSCGLRKGEIRQVTWGMFSQSQGNALLDGRGQVKNKTGRFVVPPIDPFWKLLNARIDREGWRGAPAETVLQGCKSDVFDYTFRNVGAWMRELGWTTEKTNHALRAYAGCLVAMKFGIYRASAFLRHSNVKTTEDFYGHFINERVFHPDKIRIRWARFNFDRAR